VNSSLVVNSSVHKFLLFNNKNSSQKEKKGIKVCKDINNSCEETQIMGLVYKPERDNQMGDKEKTKTNGRERSS